MQIIAKKSRLLSRRKKQNVLCKFLFGLHLNLPNKPDKSVYLLIPMWFLKKKKNIKFGSGNIGPCLILTSPNPKIPSAKHRSDQSDSSKKRRRYRRRDGKPIRRIRRLTTIIGTCQSRGWMVPSIARFELRYRRKCACLSGKLTGFWQFRRVFEVWLSLFWLWQF